MTDIMLEKIEGAIDLFGRVKVVSANPQFTYQNEYNKGITQWVEKAAGNGAATHNATDATVDLAVTTADDVIIRQTSRYFRYYSGKTHKVTTTFQAGTMVDGATFRVGYFDTNNGVFFQRNSKGLALVLRNNGDDEVIPRSRWNGGDLSSIDFSNALIMEINMQWLGVGNVEIGFERPDGVKVVAHTFRNSASKRTTYMRTANLPIRYELVASSTFAGSQSVKQICSEVSTEDGGCCQVSSYTHGVGNGITSKNITARNVVIAIRPKSTFNSIVNRSSVFPNIIDVVTGSNNIYWELVWNPTYGGTPTWSSAGDNSTVEYTVDATSISNGTVIATGYGVAGSGVARTSIARNLSTNYPLGLDVDGNNPTSIALVATSFTGTAVVNAAFNWEEVY